MKNLYHSFFWRVLLCVLAALLFCLPRLQSTIIASSSGGQGVTPHLISSVDSITAGESFEVYILLDLAKGWHVYWQYPGDSGFPPSVQWELPEGLSAGELEFALPQQFSEPGEMIVYGYENKALLRARITPNKNFSKNSIVKIRAKVSWLACNELCVPGSSNLELTLDPSFPRTAAERMMAEDSAMPILWPATTPPPFSVFIFLQEHNYVVSLQGERTCCYQLFPAPAIGSSAGRVSVKEEAGTHYQLVVPWQGEAPFHALLVGKDAIGIKRGWWLPAANSKTTLAKPSGLLWGECWKLLLALASGLLGGFILNLMPCVLPVISLKIFGFINQSGMSRSKVLRHGVAFAGGIYLWFLALGVSVVFLKASGIQVTWAFQFQNSGFLLFLTILVFLFALNLFGVFEIALPGKTTTSLDNLASRKGYAGSFFQGLFATLLATPCTAPFLGGALGFAFAQSGIVVLCMFFAVATGMAFPYLLLSIQPAWMKWLPKPGHWMERMKQFMGFPLLATNVWLLSVLMVERGEDGVIMTLALLLALGLGVWVYGSYLPTRKAIRWSAVMLSLCIVVGSLFYFVPKILKESPNSSASTNRSVATESPSASVSNNAIPWVPYSAAYLEELREKGKAVFIDFTAAWCLTCQFNERTAINTAAVRALLKERAIVPMRADWTNANPEITEALRSFGRVGVPYYVFYPAAKVGEKSVPMTFSELLTESELVKAFARP